MRLSNARSAIWSSPSPPHEEPPAMTAPPGNATPVDQVREKTDSRRMIPESFRGHEPGEEGCGGRGADGDGNHDVVEVAVGADGEADSADGAACIRHGHRCPARPVHEIAGVLDMKRGSPAFGRVKATEPPLRTAPGLNLTGPVGSFALMPARWPWLRQRSLPRFEPCSRS